MSITQETAQDCYTMAYFLLPRYIFEEDGLLDRLSRSSSGAGVFYVMASGMNQHEPQMELFRSFPVHFGDLDENTRYCIIEYPAALPVDLSDLSLEQMMALGNSVVLAPYFSAIVTDKLGEAPRYFILGQSPDGFTTLRGVTPNMNANLSSGCEPELEAFVALLRERCSASHD